ncbi:hypothetical protein ILUMI_07867 [Ignelater luminosus]|uniref:Uncharacterized protein n=1 Tax=Ignelater luminosus TaxID=2038154 RepID=A0A8K0D7E3_IGNLU|nr:hypothetical protein ILUMI_07867 [Ignelater luminosus]
MKARSMSASKCDLRESKRIIVRSMGKILRKIFDGKKVEKKSNWELKDRYREPNIVSVVKGQRLRWMSHVKKMLAKGFPKIILESSIVARRRKIGKPRARWKKEMEEDMTEMLSWKPSYLLR